MQRIHSRLLSRFGGGALAAALGATFALGSGCATTKVNNEAGRPTRYEDPASTSEIGGVGIESQDVIGMTDEMMRDMLTCAELTNRVVPPRIAIDSSFFRNESSNRINMNMITARLRVALNREAHGRMTFVGLHYADMVQMNRRLKDDGVVDSGTVGRTANAKAPDYQLGGVFTSLDGVSSGSGSISRYNQVVFEMVDVETGEIVWSGMYEVRKAAQDDVVYR